jgi:hypothetical protein
LGQFFEPLYVHNCNITPFLRFLETGFLVLGGARFAKQAGLVVLALIKWAVLSDMASVVAAEADSEVTLGGGMPGAATSVTEGGGLTVSRVMVLPTACLAVQVGFGRRRWWWDVLEQLGILVEGFFSVMVFIVSSLPLHLYYYPLKGVSFREVFQQLISMLFHFV